ncbi:poly(A)-specific ribonuclease, partial [Coemansia sp. RSA 2320]
GVEGAFVCTSAGSGSLLSLAQHGAVVRRVAVELSAVAVDFRSDALLLATVGGDLVLRDPRAGFGVALAARKAFGSNGCMVTDMVRCGSRVFACGSPAVPAHGAVVRLFDLRNLGGPAGDVEPGPGEADHSPVRLHADAQRLWICHDSGLLTTRALGGSLDVDEPFAEPPLSSYAYMSAFCVAPSGAAAAVADTDGIVHVWGETAGRGAPLLSTGRAPDLHVGGGGGGGGHAALDGVSFDDVSMPLSAAAMPPYTAPLLSRPDAERLCDVGRPAAFVDERVLGSLRLMGAVGYAPNPRSQRRNQLP